MPNRPAGNDLYLHYPPIGSLTSGVRLWGSLAGAGALPRGGAREASGGQERRSLPATNKCEPVDQPGALGGDHDIGALTADGLDWGAPFTGHVMREGRVAMGSEL